MRPHRVLSLAFAAFVASAVTSCAGDGGSPTGSDTSASSGNNASPNGTQLVLASGGSQTGVAGQPLPNPVVVRVLDTSSRPVSGATVNFVARDGSADPAQAGTDAEGRARTTWTLGSAPGPQELRVSGTGGTTVVSAVAVAPAKVARVRVIPDSMVLVAGATGDFSAVAYDSTGNALTGRTIAWTIADSAVATIATGGSVRALAPGTARATATVEGVSGSARVIVMSPPAAAVARVAVIPDSLVLHPGQTGDFNAAAYDAEGHVLTGRAVTWTSADSAVATVGADGTVTAVALGTVRIRATVEGVIGSAAVIVTSPPAATVARVEVIPDSLMLHPGQTGDFNATAYDAEGHVLTGRAVTWTSADSAVATVGADGTVTAVAVGTVRIRATVEGVSGSAAVIVTSPPAAAVARVAVIPDSLVLHPGQTGDFNATAYDAEGHVLTGRAVTWTSADSAVATVGADGTVTAVAVGTVRIRATVEGVSGSARVIVTPPPAAAVARVEVIPDSLVLHPGQTGDFNATAYDAEGHVLTGRAVTWTSADSTVATVGADGTVTAVAVGTVRIRATVEGVSGSAAVIVTSPPAVAVARVEVVPDSLVLDVGGTGDFNAVAYDAEGHALTGRVVTWTSSDSSVVVVAAGGRVTGVSPGSARVRATVEGVSEAAAVRVREPARAVVARVDLTPDSMVVQPGQTERFFATAYDANGNVLTGRAVTWVSSDSTVAAVGTGGAVTAVRPGTARVSATVEGVSGSAKVLVYGPTVVRVEVKPDSQVLVIGQTGDFSAYAYDATNHIVTGLIITWSTSDANVAPVGQYGLVSARSVGTARVTATVEGVSGSAGVRVIEQPAGSATAPPNASPDIGAGYDYVCRLRAGIIQCYGDDSQGQPIGEHHAAAGSFVQLSAGSTHACALRSDGAVECFGSNQYGEAPAQKRATAGSFTQVSAGLAHSCALRTDGAMECWGNNSHGEAPAVVTPQAGRFVVVTAFSNRTCALRNDGAVECRGFRFGTLNVTVLPGGWYVKMGTGVGITVCFERNSGLGECWETPANLGSGPFEQLTAGVYQECVLRPGGTAFCAGNPSSFQGPGERSVTGPDEGSIRPRTWARITAGSYHTCGLRADGYFECFGLQTIGSDAPDVVPSADTPKSVLSGGSVRVDWRDVNSNELRTEVDRSVADADGNPTTWARAGVLRANQTSFGDSLATPGATYVYRIRVCNAAGCSGWAQSNATRYPAAAPPAPTGVAASGYVCGFESCARVTWTADVTFVDSFRVQRRSMTGSAFGEWATVARLDREHTRFDDYALTPGTTYQYRVTACNVGGCSDYGTSNSFAASPVPPPAAPGDLTAAMMNASMMHIVWGDVATETGYELQRREYDGAAWGAWSEPVGRAMNDTHDDQYVTSGTLYQWRIRACNRGGCSAYTSSEPTRASW
ncbi:Ig-like domain (group 2) [bacterium JGI 053]|nr:Ig-like domain (group 2) [bacterium JGI 053]